MKNRLSYFFLGIAITFLLGIGGQTVCDYARIANYLDVTSSSLPSVAPSGTARIYVDSVSGTPLVSANQAGYVPLLAQPKANYIMNPEGQISQRMTRTNGLVHATDTYGFDRWKLCNSTGGNCISIPSDAYLNRLSNKSLTTNVAEVQTDCNTQTITNEHITVACNPADAIFDGAIVCNQNKVSNFFDYPITHANVTIAATGGSLKEQGLTGNSYMTFYNNSGSSGKMLAIEVLDSYQIQNLRNRTATIQFKLKGTSGIGNIHCSLIQWATSATSTGQENTNWANPFVTTWGASGTEPIYTATGVYNYSNITAVNSFTNLTGSIVHSVYSANAGPDWTQFGFTTVLPYDYNQVAIAFWTDSVVTSGNFFSLAEMGMYDAQEIQPYSVRPYQQELALCQRYCFVQGNDGNSSATGFFSGGYFSSTIGFTSTVIFPVSMRGIPVFSLVSAASKFNATDGTTNYLCSAASGNGNVTNSHMGYINWTCATATAFRGGAITGVDSTASLKFEADY